MKLDTKCIKKDIRMVQMQCRWHINPSAGGLYLLFAPLEKDWGKEQHWGVLLRNKSHH